MIGIQIKLVNVDPYDWNSNQTERANQDIYADLNCNKPFGLLVIKIVQRCKG